MEYEWLGMIRLTQSGSRLRCLILFNLLLCGFCLLSAFAAEAPKRLLVLGDSLAAGYGVEKGQAFPALLQAMIDRRRLSYEVVNAGVSGDTSAGGVRRIDWLLKGGVDVLLLELGGNDGLRGIPPATTRTNLQRIIDRTRIKNPGVKIVIAGMMMPPSMGKDYAAEFAGLFPALAKQNDAVLIPFLLEGVGGNPELNLPDLIHPTPEGHKHVAANVWRVLEPVLAPPPP